MLHRTVILFVLACASLTAQRVYTRVDGNILPIVSVTDDAEIGKMCESLERKLGVKSSVMILTRLSEHGPSREIWILGNDLQNNQIKVTQQQQLGPLVRRLGTSMPLAKQIICYSRVIEKGALNIEVTAETISDRDKIAAAFRAALPKK
jgi:hypothetical protein